MRKVKRKPTNETPCNICGGRKVLADVGITRFTDNPLGTNRKYDRWKCRACGYPVYVYHKKATNTKNPTNKNKEGK